MEFSEKLKALRAEKGVSQATLAEAIHISRSAVAKWENGLGLPGDDSLRLLCDYFALDENELIGDKNAEENAVSKNRTINVQSTALIVVNCLFAAALIVINLLFSETMRENFSLIFFGLVFVILGAFNLKGNIASIHWYNRRKVSKENQLPYCRLVGLGTVICGVGMLLAASSQIILSRLIGDAPAILLGGAVTIAGIAVGIVLILIAQFKYNKGLF